MPFVPHTFFVVSDKKDCKGGYWRNTEIENDLRMSGLFTSYSSVEYKGNRSRTHPESFMQIYDIGMSYLEKYNIPFFHADGFEADDFAGAIYRIFIKEKVPARKVFLHTSDRDWTQLVDGRHQIYWANVRVPGLNEAIQNRLAEECHVIEHTLYRMNQYITHPSQLSAAKVIVGDDGDNLPAGAPIEYFDLCNPHPKYRIEDLELYPALVEACANTQITTNDDHLDKSLELINKLNLIPPILI